MRVSELLAALAKLPSNTVVFIDVDHKMTVPVYIETTEHTVVLRNYVIQQYAQTITCDGTEYESVQRTFGRGKE
jgi:hypothetical protein